jgi:nucleoside-diphosphate-sugar epimerase
MKILLVGATGVIGRLLLPLLTEARHDVAGTTRSPTKAKEIEALGGRPMVVDAFDRSALFAVLRNEHPDVVIHQLTDLGTLDFVGNSRLLIEGTRNLVDVSLAMGVQRMIAQSLAFVYRPGAGPADEDEPLDLNASDAVERAVIAVQSLERAVAEMPVGVVLRYGLFYGPGTWYSRNGLTSEQIQRGEVEATDGITSFVHVADAAQAAVQALNWPAGLVNIVDDAPAKGTEWVTEYARLIGAPAPPFKPDAAAWERGATNAKARRLGWEPRYANWREGFRAELG